MDGRIPELEQHGSRRLLTTQWSLVLAAGDTRDPKFQESLTQLCSLYWLPVFAFIRRRGYDRDDALDLTQAFFAALIEKNRLKAADPGRGRFRSFLLSSVQNFLNNENQHRSALKRGGGYRFLPLDMEQTAGGLPEPADDSTPDRVYERQWAIAVLEQAMNQLRQEQEKSGNRERFRALEGYLTGLGDDTPYREVGLSLGLSEEAVKTAVYRLRRRFGMLLRRFVAQTVLRVEETDDEIRFLLAALAR